MDTTAKNVDNMRHAYRMSLLLWMVTFLVISVAWYWFAVTPVPTERPLMTIHAVDGHNQAMCPGEVLTYTYTAIISQPGVYLFDSSVWREDATQIVVWTDPLRVVSSEPRTVYIVRHWTLPPAIYDVLTDSVQPWWPGQYTRSIAITASGRNTLPSVASIPFTIREDCE